MSAQTEKLFPDDKGSRLLYHALTMGSWRNRLRHWFLAPFGRLRKPRPLLYDKYWEKYTFPICPHCGEIPCGKKACYFCGQRFTKEENENA